MSEEVEYPLIRLAIFEDHPITAAGLKGALDALGGLRVDLLATDLKQLMVGLELQEIHLLIADVIVPGVEGLELFQRVRQEFPDLPLVAYTSLNNLTLMRQLYRLGVAGFVNKREEIPVLEHAVRAVLAGESVFPDGFNPPKRKETIDSESTNLSTREREILTLIAEGLLTKEIAHRLGISINTVNIHRGNLFRKFHVQNVGELIREAHNLGYLGQ